MVHWALAGSSLQHIIRLDAALARAHFNRPEVLITGPFDRVQYQVPRGWTSTPAVNYKSYGAFVHDVQANRIDFRIEVMYYNPEMWADTPLREQRDPYLFMGIFCSLAAQKGWTAQCAPARNLVAVSGSVCPQETGEPRSEAYLRCELARAAAAQSTAIDIQAQIHQTALDEYVWFVEQAAEQARNENPDVVVRANLTTELQDAPQNPETLLTAHQATAELVSGHWFNVTAATAQVAIDFLRMLDG